MNNVFSKHTLPNGIRLILVPDSAKQVVTSLVLFGVGSRYETDSEAGISHVLEHMPYKGTKKRPTALKIAEFIEEVGGEHNAFTSKEYTGYYAKVASKYLTHSLDFLSDLLVEPLFDAEELEREKNVILQELDMYEDLPMEVAANKFEQALFGHNSLGRDVIGTKKSIKDVTRKSLIAYRDQFYVGENCVIVLAGNFGQFNEQEIVSLVEDRFIFPHRKASAFHPIVLPERKKPSLIFREIEQSHVVIGFPGVAYSDRDRYAMRLLALILGGSMSSRMFTEIREQRGLAYAVRSSASNYLDAGTLETYAGVPHAKVPEATAAIIAEFDKIKTGITEQELKRAKEYLYGRLLIGLEDTNEIANHYGMSLLLTGQILTPEQVSAKYETITIDDVKMAAHKYIQKDKMAFSFVGQNVEPEALSKIIGLE